MVTDWRWDYVAADPLITGFAQLPACVIELERGALDEASKRLEPMQLVTSLGVADFTVGVLLARTRWLYLSNQHEQVFATVAEADTVTGDRFESCRLDLLLLTIRSANAVDDDERADRARAALDEIVGLGGGRMYRAAATWARGVAAARRGAFDDASTALACC